MMKQIDSQAYVLMHNNIDTDQIIPAKFLKATDRKGFGEHLFANWRYDSNGNEHSDFPVNSYNKGKSILIAGNNFGCGSSREHAAWALEDFGIRVIISSEFADIFKGNAYNNDILPIELDSKTIERLVRWIDAYSDLKICVDLELQTVAFGEEEVEFLIPPLKKTMLLEDTNETEYLINMRDEIADYEAAHAILNL